MKSAHTENRQNDRWFFNINIDNITDQNAVKYHKKLLIHVLTNKTHWILTFFCAFNFIKPFQAIFLDLRLIHAWISTSYFNIGLHVVGRNYLFRILAQYSKLLDLQEKKLFIIVNKCKYFVPEIVWLACFELMIRLKKAEKLHHGNNGWILHVTWWIRRQRQKHKLLLIFSHTVQIISVLIWLQ